jgi:hypothetical protein
MKLRVAIFGWHSDAATLRLASLAWSVLCSCPKHGHLIEARGFHDDPW